jgi:lambda family phage portal protein
MPKLNWLDRTIAAVSPTRGFERAKARAMTERVVKAYEAGKIMPRGKEWAASNAGPNAQLGPALRWLRQRSREVTRDGSYAASAIEIRVAHEIGYGISPRPKTGDVALNARVTALWDQWAAQADLHGRLNFYGLQALAARTRLESGEALMRIVRLDPAKARKQGLAVPLQLEVLEPDLLDDAPMVVQDNGLRVVDGIEFNAQGQRTAYRVLRSHPGENQALFYAGEGTRFDRIQAQDMVHLVRVHAQRPGQVRGVPDAAGVLLRLRRLEEYEEAAVEQAKIQALIGVFYQTPNPIDVVGSVGTQDPSPEQPQGLAADIYPGMVANLPIGTEVKFLQPSGSGAFEPFALHELMAIARGFRVTYDQLTGDLRQANYSSLRAGKIEFRRDVEQDQWLMHIPLMCQPVWDAFVTQATLSGALPERAYPVEWATPRFEMIDPTREIPATINAVRSGLETWQQAVSSMGYDPVTQADEIQSANKLFDDRGLVLDVDPRRMSVSGSAQDAKQNAAVELAVKNG